MLLVLLTILYGQPDVSLEGETGKVYRANFRDRHGRTVLILRPAMQVLECCRFILLIPSAFVTFAED